MNTDFTIESIKDEMLTEMAEKEYNKRMAVIEAEQKEIERKAKAEANEKARIEMSNRLSKITYAFDTIPRRLRLIARQNGADAGEEIVADLEALNEKYTTKYPIK